MPLQRGARVRTAPATRYWCEDEGWERNCEKRRSLFDLLLFFSISVCSQTLLSRSQREKDEEGKHRRAHAVPNNPYNINDTILMWTPPLKRKDDGRSRHPHSALMFVWVDLTCSHGTLNSSGFSCCIGKEGKNLQNNDIWTFFRPYMWNRIFPLYIRHRLNTVLHTYSFQLILTNDHPLSFIFMIISKNMLKIKT